MAGSDEQERIAYYQSREQVGPYLSKLYSFFPGQPTIPNNATANKAIYINNGLGPGAKILNGITPFVPAELPCDEVIITNLQVAFVDPTLTISIVYNLMPPDDIITLFNTSTGQVLSPVAYLPIVGGIAVEFDVTSPPATVGSWSLKIARLSDPAKCFTVRNGIFQLAGAVCAIDAGAWTNPGGIPFGGFIFGVGPPLPVEIAGSGFLSCPIGVSVDRTGGSGGPLTQTVSSLVVVNDNLITFDVSRDAITSSAAYLATVFCTDASGCSDEADNPIGFIVF